jgi:hypothetical protein
LDVELVALWVCERHVVRRPIVHRPHVGRAEFGQSGHFGVPARWSHVQVNVEAVLDGLGLRNGLEEQAPPQTGAAFRVNRIVRVPHRGENLPRGPARHRGDVGLANRAEPAQPLDAALLSSTRQPSACAQKAACRFAFAQSMASFQFSGSCNCLY